MALYFCTMLISSYPQAVEFLYQNLPMYQRVGAVAYKADLTNTIQLCEALGNPHYKFKNIHVAGTNGKGSSSHMLAAVLQCAGYKTGLYTSPHLKNFTERIRINGQEIDQAFVVDFVNRIQSSIDKIQPSFFEITVAMAFDYFARQKVDIAVVEVGLGGRLDSTNVITPLVSLITNISWDHMNLLGDTLPKIAFEKAGIIKKEVPVVISETQDSIKEVFVQKSKSESSSIVFADKKYEVVGEGYGKFQVTDDKVTSTYELDLKGIYQQKNLAGVLATLDELKNLGFKIPDEATEKGLSNTTTLTGLKGRWQKLKDNPLTICDTGHNEAGVIEILKQIKAQKFEKLFMVWGMVNDKDVSKILSILPSSAYYFFCQANIPRAMDANELFLKAKAAGLRGEVILNVNNAICQANERATQKDMIFIGGSTFLVAEIENL